MLWHSRGPTLCGRDSIFGPGQENEWPQNVPVCQELGSMDAAQGRATVLQLTQIFAAQLSTVVAAQLSTRSFILSTANEFFARLPVLQTCCEFSVATWHSIEATNARGFGVVHQQELFKFSLYDSSPFLCKDLLILGHGGGLVVSVLAFCSDNSSLTPADN